MFLGDRYPSVNDMLATKYGNYLKSNILQFAHHGFEGGTAALYNRIAASVLLWPCSEWSFNQHKDDAVNLIARSYTQSIRTVGHPHQDIFVGADDI